MFTDETLCTLVIEFEYPGVIRSTRIQPVIDENPNILLNFTESFRVRAVLGSCF